MSNLNTALQVTDFDFYGDTLMALRDNATGDIYTAINFVLRGIGFNNQQSKHIHKKWTNDIAIAKGVQNFHLPSNGGIQEMICISIRKLPLALAKINITPKMKRDQSELSKKLELYQDKCADVLASVFLDNKSTNAINTKLLTEAMTTSMSLVLTTALNPIYEELRQNQQMIQSQIPKKKSFSSWTSKMFPKYQLLMDYFDIGRKELYHNLFIEFQNTYPDIDLRQEQEDYCFENGLESCFTLELIEHNKKLRMLFTSLVDSLLEKYDMTPQNDQQTRESTIFDS